MQVPPQHRATDTFFNLVTGVEEEGNGVEEEEGTGVEEEEDAMFLCQVQRDHWVLVRRREHQLLTQQ